MRFMRDMLVMEQDNVLHLGRGIARGWLGSGEEVGIERASTRFGDLSYRMRYDKKRGQSSDGSIFRQTAHRYKP